MEKLLNFLTGSKIIGISLGVLLLIAGSLSRIQFINSNVAIGFIVPLLFISLSFGIIFSTVFRRDNKSVKGLFIKSVLAPLAIVVSILALDNFGIESPILKAGSLFLINIIFFGKEINKAFN
ncbi:MAG: hypothetical protein MJA82_21300 [Clostridia bacterium]|nr:hypothetical protein [Clostridia bacterium]